MSSCNVLSAYEKLAGLTGKMAEAARADDWKTFSRMENECRLQVEPLTQGKAAPLSGACRQRKVDLLKAILANDRKIRDVTDTWQAQLAGIMQASGTASTAR